MYTRCPECQTTFRITVTQLKARDGLVRCGRCDSIFRADLRLFAPPAAETNHIEEIPESEMFIDLGSDEAIDASSTQQETEPEIPVVSDLSFFEPRRRLVPTALWLIATMAFSALLLGQFAYFYRHELAQLPGLRTPLLQICGLLHCDVVSPTAGTVPELVQTSIAPHPRYANALRIRANVANRTDQTQPLPLIQVSLTDSDGKLLARRTFAPREYLGPSSAAVPLGPHVAMQTLLDVTNPDNKAAGYEVQLFPQQPARAD